MFLNKISIRPELGFAACSAKVPLFEANFGMRKSPKAFRATVRQEVAKRKFVKCKTRQTKEVPLLCMRRQECGALQIIYTTRKFIPKEVSYRSSEKLANLLKEMKK